MRKARIVIDALCNARLAAQGAALDYGRVYALTGSIERSGQSCWPSAHDDKVVVFSLGLGAYAQLCC